MADMIWKLERGEGSVVATAIHDGHQVRPEVLRCMALDEPTRLREEDPFTGRWAEIVPTRVVGLRSRFEVDLNRTRENAVYRTPDDSWGLAVWRNGLPDDIVHRSLLAYDAFYAALGELYASLADRYGRFVVLDLHSYNHLRDGTGQPPADAGKNPQINIGTGTIGERDPWAQLIDRFKGDLAAYDFPGGSLDVRENVKFRGGAHAAWAHRRFPEEACVLSVEVKKFFMSEWTGEPDEILVAEIGKALQSTLAGVHEELKKV